MNDYFERWWALVWRKERKLAAMREYRIAIDNDFIDYEELCRATRKRTAAYLRDKTETRHQTMPATWLAERRWTDELPEVGPSGADLERKRRLERCVMALRGIKTSAFDLVDVREALRLGDLTKEQAAKLGVREVSP